MMKEIHYIASWYCNNYIVWIKNQINDYINKLYLIGDELKVASWPLGSDLPLGFVLEK